MKELNRSVTVYYTAEDGGNIRISAERPVTVEDAAYDRLNKEWVFAVKCYDEGSMYHIDYIFTDISFQLKNILTEAMGVNPKFITAPDGSLWVSLSATASERNGEIVLPLYDRARITKDKISADTGMAFSFDMGNDHYSYAVNYFDKKKPDRLFHYQFDKNNLFRTRKQFKLEGVWNGHPAVISDRLYVVYTERAADLITICVAEVNGAGSVLSVWKSHETEGINSLFIRNFTDTEIVFTACTGHSADTLRFSSDGSLLSRKAVYETSQRINTMTVKDNAVMITTSDEEDPLNVRNLIIFTDTDPAVCYECDNGYHPLPLAEHSYAICPVNPDSKGFVIVRE